MIGVATVIADNLIISNLEQNVPVSELNCIMRDLRFQLSTYEKPNQNRFYRILKAVVERGERYAN